MPQLRQRGAIGAISAPGSPGQPDQGAPRPPNDETPGDRDQLPGMQRRADRTHPAPRAHSGSALARARPERDRRRRGRACRPGSDARLRRGGRVADVGDRSPAAARRALARVLGAFEDPPPRACGEPPAIESRALLDLDSRREIAAKRRSIEPSSSSGRPMTTARYLFSTVRSSNWSPMWARVSRSLANSTTPDVCDRDGGRAREGIHGARACRGGGATARSAIRRGVVALGRH